MMGSVFEEMELCIGLHYKSFFLCCPFSVFCFLSSLFYNSESIQERGTRLSIYYDALAFSQHVFSGQLITLRLWGSVVGIFIFFAIPGDNLLDTYFHGNCEGNIMVRKKEWRHL
ncbi:hypothetical protein BDD12DRAFT_824561 [Trichophaea hybrida]|nr:hypothetical protein BDD12DRAFT_830944 [Trichophaea hybrida]KAF8542491.1 hypothetical protein BDD12DRAFT_824561 [Trichophaea hybrida]